MTDKQFYTELIRQCEVVLPMVDDHIGLCSFTIMEKLDILLQVSKIIGRSIYKTKNFANYSKIPSRGYFGYVYTPAWKQDRVELLEMIINYCKSKL